MDRRWLPSVALMIAIGACSDPDNGGNAGNAGSAGSAGSADNAGSAAMSASGGMGGDGASGTHAGGSSTDTGGSTGVHEDGSVADASDDASAIADASDVDADFVYEEANNDCLDGITDFVNAGPFAFEKVVSNNVKVWVPSVPTDCKVPIVHFMNGTGGVCDSYVDSLEHLASHGFLVTCTETGQSDDGSLCLTAIETALTEFPELADMKVGSSGHESGGGGAIACVGKVEQRWGPAIHVVGHAIAPASGNGTHSGWQEDYAAVTSPMFLFNGSDDVLVSESWVGSAFDALDPAVEAYWYEGTGAPHIPVPTRWITESAVAWFRWKLLGDTNACEHFKAMPMGTGWDLQEARNATDC